MGKYILTNRALDDLNEIWNFTFEKWSEEQADKYYEELLAAFQSIADKPISGKHYEQVHPGLMGQRTGSHVVFFRSMEKYTEITRILHGRMDLKRRIED